MTDTKLATVYRDREAMAAGLQRLAAQAGHYDRLGVGSYRVLADMAHEILAGCEVDIAVPVLRRRMDQFPAESLIPCVAYFLGDGDYRHLTVGRDRVAIERCEAAYKADPTAEWKDDPYLYRRLESTAVGEVVDVLVLVEYAGTPEPCRPTEMCQGSRVLADEHPPTME